MAPATTRDTAGAVGLGLGLGLAKAEARAWAGARAGVVGRVQRPKTPAKPSAGMFLSAVPQLFC